MLASIYSSFSTFYLKNGLQSLNFLIFASAYYISTLFDYAVSSLLTYEANFLAIFTLKAINSSVQLLSIIFLGYSCVLALTTFFWTAAEYTPSNNNKDKGEKITNFRHTIILMILLGIDIVFYTIIKKLDGFFVVYFLWTFLGGIWYSGMLTYKLNLKTEFKLIRAAHICLGAMLLQGIPVFLVAGRRLIFFI